MVTVRGDYIASLLDKISVRDLTKLSSPLILGDIDTWGYVAREDDKGTVSDDGMSITAMLTNAAPGAAPFAWYPSYLTGIGAPLLIRSLSQKREVDAICDYFYNQALRIAKQNGIRAVTICDMANFYLVTNLVESRMREVLDSGYMQERLEEVEEKLNGELGGGGSHFIRECGIFMTEGITSVAKNSKQLAASMRDIGEQYRRLVFDFGDDGQLKAHVALLDGHKCIALGKSCSIVSQVTVPHPFSHDLLGQLESLINSRSAREDDLQQFFESHPEFLSMGAYTTVYAQVALLREDGTTLRPDFLLEPASGPLCSVLDIKLPKLELFVRQKNRPRFSAKVYEYVAQLREYGDYFDSPANRRWFKEKYGITAFRPRLIVVAGKTYGAADRALLERLRSSLDPIEIFSYDELIEAYLRNGGNAMQATHGSKDSGK